jgi:hypothetical protein
MLVFGLFLAGCDNSSSTPPHELTYVLKGGTLTISGDGESLVPKDGDRFTLETFDGKEVTGTIEVAEGGTITFKNNEGVSNVIPPATIPSGGESISIEAGEITFDDGTKGQQDADTASPVLPPPPPTDEYDLYWGFIDGATYAEMEKKAADDADVSLIAAGSTAGYVAGKGATAGYSQMDSKYFDNFGTVTGSFEKLLDFSEDGIGLPSALKTEMTKQKANLPIAAIFEVKDQGVVVFFITEHEEL